MTAERCLYALLHAPEERHDAILRELVAPISREIRESAQLDSLFFARYNEPDWQVRFRILGRPEWVDGTVRELLVRHLDRARGQGLFESHELAEYRRETERYGGEEGMRLSEQIFLHDSLACLDLLDAEAKGLMGKSRREYSLIMTERFLDLLGFDRDRRIAFYAFAHSWAIETGAWEPREIEILAARYRELRDGLVDLLEGAQAGDPETQWGGAEAMRIGQGCLTATARAVERLLEAHRAGRIAQDLVHLTWSLTHMHCNRLGVDANAEAILRYFMHRLYQEGAVGTG